MWMVISRKYMHKAMEESYGAVGDLLENIHRMLLNTRTNQLQSYPNESHVILELKVLQELHTLIWN